MAMRRKRRTLDIGFDGEPEGVELGKNQISGLLGRDRDGVWFFAGLPVEVEPGIEETLLDVGWYPGMPPGQEIVIVEDDGTGRRAYVVHHGSEISYRCFRRTWRGFCNKRTIGPCERHRKMGDTTTKGPALSTRVDIRKVEMPSGWKLVGVIPGMGNTYFARSDLTGVIKPVCMRQRSLGGLAKAAEQGKSLHPRCMARPMYKDGKPYGPCYRHRWGGKKALSFKHKMDPKFRALVNRAAASNPAVDQLRNRLDMISRSWYFYLDAIVKRQKLLDEGEPRDTGLDAVLKAAVNVARATKIQSKQQSAIFQDTGRVWAQQAYSLRLAQALAEACKDETPTSIERIGIKMRKAMVRRGLITKDRDLPAIIHQQTVTVADDMQPSIEGIKARHIRELEFVEALLSVRRAVDYTGMVDLMEDRMLSLYPLIQTLDDLIVIEVAAEAPITTVLNRINATALTVMGYQETMEKGLDLRLTQRQVEEITGNTIAAVMEAIEEERPTTQVRILTRFNELKTDVKMPTRADDAVQIVMEAIKDRVKEQYR